MTTQTDEIANLRRALEDIRDYCLNGVPMTLTLSREQIGQLAERALKTPRASKLTPISQIGLDNES